MVGVGVYKLILGECAIGGWFWGVAMGRVDS